MSKFVVVVFPNERKAYEGTSALRELHAEGSLTLYSLATIAKEPDGRFSIKQAADQGPLGFGVGALVGGMVGLLGGPVGAAAGMGAGGLIGGIADIASAGVQADFLQAVSDKLTPGKTAVIAEVDEDWVTPLDTRMEALNGEIIREWRSDFEDEQIARAMKERQAELAQLKEEMSQSGAEAKAKLKARIDETQAKLKAAAKRAQDRVGQLEQNVKAKVKELEDQASKASGDVKVKIERRIAADRADYQRRTGQLKQAWEQTKHALAA
jgi:uncharacterized membrane protein